MKKTLKITKRGSITLPKDMRCKAGIMPGQAIDISINDDNSIAVHKHSPSCFICGGYENIVAFKNFEICENCRKEIKNYE